VQNASPATSIGVVDRQLEKMVSEIQTPGCFGVYPAQGALRVSTLCGDGTMLTVSLSPEGMPTDKQKSPEFFDPTDNALFVAPAQNGDL
jgi:methylamine dehydrogenase heavy chain